MRLLKSGGVNKRLISSFAVALLGVAFVGCGNQSMSAEESAQAKVEAPVAKKAAAQSASESTAKAGLRHSSHSEEGDMAPQTGLRHSTHDEADGTPKFASLKAEDSVAHCDEADYEGSEGSESAHCDSGN